MSYSNGTRQLTIPQSQNPNEHKSSSTSINTTTKLSIPKFKKITEIKSKRVINLWYCDTFLN